jgi:hypothetical protein
MAPNAWLDSGYWLLVRPNQQPVTSNFPGIEDFAFPSGFVTASAKPKEVAIVRWTRISREGLTVGLLAAAATALSATSAQATEPGMEPAVTHPIVKEDFRGWPNTYRLTNGLVELRVVTDVGPRVISFRTLDGNDVFYSRERELGKKDEPDWTFRGGWRLWVSPEVKETTYVLDNSSCTSEIVDGALIVTGPPQPAAGIQKQIEVRLRPIDPAVRIVSRIKNISDKPLTYAAWSLAVLRPGGRALLPLDVGPLTAFDATRSVIFWSYAEIDDPRYKIGNALLQVDHTKVKSPPATQSQRRDDESKIGVDSAQGWASYVQGGTMFVKRFPHESQSSYPDAGSTIEVYSSVEFLELENLGPLTTIAPGEEIVMPEEWWLFTGVDIPEDETAALTALRPYLIRTRVDW